jgi:hypothetical protein
VDGLARGEFGPFLICVQIVSNQLVLHSRQHRHVGFEGSMNILSDGVHQVV